MCFSENISLSIALTGLLSAFYLYINEKIYASIGIGYFSLMELIQYFQYKVINQCDNRDNIFLTKLGYIHICFQPLFFNLWLFAFTEKPNYLFIKMSFFAGLLLASRLFFVTDRELCDVNNEPLCGKNTCSISGEKHIAWNIRLRSAGKNWFTPSIGLHFFLWVIPILIIGELRPILAMIITGPYLGYLLTSNKNERPAIWCYSAIAQIIISHLLLL